MPALVNHRGMENDKIHIALDGVTAARPLRSRRDWILLLGSRGGRRRRGLRRLLGAIGRDENQRTRKNQRGCENAEARPAAVVIVWARNNLSWRRH